MALTPFVSVVIPTYNRLRKVTSALESVLAQSYSNFEVIVVDDGSEDGTGQEIERLISKRPSSSSAVRYIFQSNQGSSAARNRGISEAHGQWVAFLDSDDIWYPDKLEWQVRAVDVYKDACGACITNARLVNDSGMDTTSFQLAGKSYAKEIGLAENAVENLARSPDHFWVTSLMVRSDLAQKVGGFDPNIHFCEDNDFNFRLSLNTSFCYVNKVLVQLDRSAESSVIRPWEKAEVRLRNRQRMLEKWLEDAGLSHEVRKIVARNLRKTHSAWANWYLEAGRYEEARGALSAAMKIEPTGPLTVKWLLARVAPSFVRKLVPKTRSYTA